MKLYSFDYESYGQFYLIMSDSPQEALEALKKFLLQSFQDEYRVWKDVTVDKLPRGYILKVFEKDEVFEGEWS